MKAVFDALVESELFGGDKGGFTDARQSRPGRFERARSGSSGYRRCRVGVGTGVGLGDRPFDRRDTSQPSATFRRKYRSSRKRPATISSRRSRLVAATTRTSTRVSVPPTRSISPSCPPPRSDL
jgi:hypothetical protein